MNGKERQRFRSSKEWKAFRLTLLKGRSNTCEFCSKQSNRGLTVHHRDMDKDHYTDLSNQSHFSLLCYSCHKLIHYLYVCTKRKSNPTTDKTIAKIVNRFFI